MSKRIFHDEGNSSIIHLDDGHRIMISMGLNTVWIYVRGFMGLVNRTLLKEEVREPLRFSPEADERRQRLLEDIGAAIISCSRLRQVEEYLMGQQPVITGIKRCIACATLLPLYYFPIEPTHVDGHGDFCPGCLFGPSNGSRAESNNCEAEKPPCRTTIRVRRKHVENQTRGCTAGYAAWKRATYQNLDVPPLEPEEETGRILRERGIWPPTAQGAAYSETPDESMYPHRPHFPGNYGKVPPPHPSEQNDSR